MRIRVEFRNRPSTRLLILCSLMFGVSLPAQTPTVSPNSDAASVVPQANYVLAPNDLISIKVFQEDDLETHVRVAKDATITFPLVGVVRVGGKTPQEAARTFRAMLAKGYLVNPQVTVSTLEYFKYRLTVLGEVQKPGSYDFPDRDRLTLLEAIGLAGGYTRGADPSKVLIKRVVNGRETVYRLNAKNMASEGSTAAFEVLSGDVITVAESIF